MADKSFGVKELNLLNASGTPTITSPNNLNLNANTVAISTSVTVGQNITVSANAGIASLNVTGIATITRPSTDNSIQRYVITNNSDSDYRFTGPGQDGAENDPDIYLVRGHRYVFTHNATTDHPIQIRVASGGAAYTDGVTYSDTGNNRTTQGNDLIINVQHDAPARLYYQCTSHSGMVGNIYIVGGPQVISGVVTATTFSGSGASLTNLPAANLTGTLPALAAPNLTSLPAANLTGTLPAISGANLTSLPSQVTINNASGNRVITSDGGTTLNGEDTLRYDGTNFLIGTNTEAPYSNRNLTVAAGGSGSGTVAIEIRSASNGTGRVIFSDGTSADSSANEGQIIYQQSDHKLLFGVAANYQNMALESTGGTGADLNIIDGNLKFASGHGIDFSANTDDGGTSTATLLEDYEEGSYTITSNANLTMDNQRTGYYTKIGNLVNVIGYLSLNTNDGSPSVSGTNGIVLSLPYARDTSTAAYTGTMLQQNINSDTPESSVGHPLWYKVLPVDYVCMAASDGLRFYINKIEAAYTRMNNSHLHVGYPGYTYIVWNITYRTN